MASVRVSLKLLIIILQIEHKIFRFDLPHLVIFILGKVEVILEIMFATYVTKDDSLCSSREQSAPGSCSQDDPVNVETMLLIAREALPATRGEKIMCSIMLHKTAT